MAHNGIPFAEPPSKRPGHRFSRFVHAVMIGALALCGAALAVTWMLR